MKTIRVLVLFVMGVSAFSGFAQEGASSLGVGAGAPAGSAVVLIGRPRRRNERLFPRTSIRLRRFRNPLSKVQELRLVRRLARQPRA